MNGTIRWIVLVSLFLAGCASVPSPDEGQRDTPVTSSESDSDSESDSEPEPESESDSESDPEEPSPGPEVPGSTAEARALWERDGTAVLPLLATFFQMVDLGGAELQGSFELLREISAAVAPDDPAASSMLASTRGFLRLPLSAAVRLPGEPSPVPWKYALRLLVGLRFSGELGPELVRVVREREGEGLDPRRDVVRNALYGISYLAYTPGSSLVVRSAGACEDLECRILALEMLALLGDPVAAPVVIETIETGSELSLIQPAARTLQSLVGPAAEPTLAKLLEREEPELRRAALAPLLSIATPSALGRIVALKDSTADVSTQRAIVLLLKRYGRPLGLSAAELEKLIRTSPEDAAHRMAPFVHRLEQLADDDRRLSREDLGAVMAHWAEAGTLYTPEWDWVRDRHIVSAATLEDEPALEAIRRSVLKEYRSTSLNEAHIVQRMILAIRAKARE